MRQANRDKQNSRRMSGALMCAALLHFALFIALDRFAHFPDASLSPDRSNVTSIQLTLPQAHPEPSPQSAKEITPVSTTNKIVTKPSQPKDQVDQNNSRAKPDAKETKQKSLQSPVETAQSAPTPPASKKTEHTTGKTPQQKPIAHNPNEVSAKDMHDSSTYNIEAELAAMEQLYHRRAAEGIPQASNQVSASHQEFTVYLQHLIEEKRRYPRAARRRNIEGSVEFSVHVNREGALAELTLNSSSGSRILDKAAEDLLEKVFPVDYPLQEKVRTTIRIIYKLTEV